MWASQKPRQHNPFEWTIDKLVTEVKIPVIAALVIMAAVYLALELFA